MPSTALPLGNVMIGVAGVELNAEEHDLLRHPAVGGVVLFTHNCIDREQLQQLTAAIAALRNPPLLIAVDQEGGAVQRCQSKHGFSTLPAAAAYGRAYDRSAVDGLALARSAGWLMATELRAVGVDLSFAPVLDLRSKASRIIGERGFHAEPDAVIDIGRAWARGVAAAGMRTVAKHFPGHGTVVSDSHLELPVDERDYQQISARDLRPFSRLLGAEIDACMSAHVRYSAVDQLPATFSPYWLREVLRHRIGFDGAVFSDALEMEGARVMGDIATCTAEAIAVGCDMVLVCNAPAQTPKALDAALPHLPTEAATRRLAALRATPPKPVVTEHLAYVRNRISALVELERKS